jgi:hypothetical protein
MSYIRSKTIKGNQYLYEQESYRENGSVKTRHIKYIGQNNNVELGTTQVKPYSIMNPQTGEKTYFFTREDAEESGLRNKYREETGYNIEIKKEEK